MPPDLGRGAEDKVWTDFGFSILIVDDAEDARYVYEKHFTFRGARAMTAEDGAIALRIVRHDPPDVIVVSPCPR